MKKIISLIRIGSLLMVSCFCQSQEATNFSNVRFVQTYGLEDSNTKEYIKYLLSDTNNFILLDNYGSFKINSLFDTPHLFFAGEELQCTENITSLLNEFKTGRLIGYNYNSSPGFPDFYFKTLDSVFYQSMLDSFKTNSLNSIVSQMDSIERVNISLRFTNHFNLSQLDSLLLNNMIHGISFTTDHFSSIGLTKNYYYLFSDYGTKNGLENFLKIHTSLNHNVMVFMPLVGNKNYTLLNLKNKTRRTTKKKALYTTLDDDDLRSKTIRLSSECVLNKKDYDSVDFLLIKKLDICLFK